MQMQEQQAHLQQQLQQKRTEVAQAAHKFEPIVEQLNQVSSKAAAAGKQASIAKQSLFQLAQVHETSKQWARRPALVRVT